MFLKNVMLIFSLNMFLRYLWNIKVYTLHDTYIRSIEEICDFHIKQKYVFAIFMEPRITIFVTKHICFLLYFVTYGLHALQKQKEIYIPEIYDLHISQQEKFQFFIKQVLLISFGKRVFPTFMKYIFFCNSKKTWAHNVYRIY